MFKLFARPGAGSAAIEAILAECGAAFTVIDVPKEADGSAPASLLRLNPRGEVPTLVLPDDSIMTESAAIAIYLADLFPQAGLAPALSAATRARYLRWILYFATAVYAADLRMYYPDRYSVDAEAAPGIKAKAIADMDIDFDIFALELGRGPFVLGETFSAADIYIAMLVTWAADMDALFVRHPNIKTHYDLVAARPLVAAAWVRNGMPVAS